MDREQFGKRLAAAAGMPMDVVAGASVVTVTGSSAVRIENYRGITEYTECLVRVRTRNGQIRLSGDHLCVEYYMNDEMKITGDICRLEFIKGGNCD